MIQGQIDACGLYALSNVLDESAISEATEVERAIALKVEDCLENSEACKNKLRIQLPNNFAAPKFARAGSPM